MHSSRTLHGLGHAPLPLGPYFDHTPLFYRKEPMMRHFPSDTIMPRTFLYQIVSSIILHRAAEQGECGIPVTALLRA